MGHRWRSIGISAAVWLATACTYESTYRMPKDGFARTVWGGTAFTR